MMNYEDKNALACEKSSKLSFKFQMLVKSGFFKCASMTFLNKSHSSLEKKYPSFAYAVSSLKRR